MESRVTPSSCTSCAADVPAGARFCPSCGTRITDQDTKSNNGEGEHRQITVMFCDLIDSTKLSTQIDSEDLREVLQQFQAVCAHAIESREGMIAKYLGDGVMAYFGYPKAVEDAAIRAADAALEITRNISELGDRLKSERGIELATRVALHTGRVLISEMGAGETREYHAITGVVPNVAARLEQFAPRNSVAISSQTRALIEGAFQVEPLGTHELKGLSDAVDIFKIAGYAPATSFLPNLDKPVEGRERELEILQQAWSRARNGGYERLVISAEPGVGKSVLAAAFVKESGIRRRSVGELSGTMHDRHTPFACLRHTIGRWLDLTGGREDDHAKRRMASWFETDEGAASHHAEALWRLWIGESTEGPEGRNAIISAGLALIDNMPKPSIIIVDDAHWVDPSTMEILDRASALKPEMRMVLILTRPGIDEEWKRSEDITIQLSGLPDDACSRLVESVAGGRVDPALVRRITDATDGLPLYVEEFTKSLVVSEFVRHERGVLRLVNLNLQAMTPASLLDLITTRLDVLGNAKVFAQISSVLGRTFERAALVKVSGATIDAVDTAIAVLSVAGILTVARGGRLSFRHALFQTAAYESIVRRARHKWHENYVSWLQSDPKRLAATRPETLGYHLEACGRTREAVDCYFEAGLTANQASASLEAAAHFQKCVDHLTSLPSEEAVKTQKLRAQVLLGGALLSARGPGSPETRTAYDRALDLAERTEECEWHFPAYWGWWRVSDSFATMALRAQRLLEVSEQMQGQEFKLQAKHCVWANAFQIGALDESVVNARQGVALYDDGGFEDLGTLYGGHDCKVCALGEIGLASWLQGAGDATVEHVQAAMSHAGHLGHLGSMMHALDIAVMLHHYRRDGSATAELAQRLFDLGTQHDLEEYRAKGEIFLGWERILSGAVEQGLACINAGFQITQAIGTPEDFPVYQCMRAEGMRLLGDADGALAVLAEGREIIVSEGVNYWGAEIARNEAESEMLRKIPDAEFIADRLNEAKTVARSQGALALELRAGMSALNWARMQGDAETAEADLAEVLGRFEPSADGADLEDAKAMIGFGIPQ